MRAAEGGQGHRSERRLGIGCWGADTQTWQSPDRSVTTRRPDHHPESVTTPDEQQPFTHNQLAPPPSPRRSRALPIAIVAAATLVALGLAALGYAILNRPTGTVAGDGQPNSRNASPISSVSVPPSVEPRTLDAAKALAQREGDAYAAGDWAGAWDLFTKAGKAAISRADYVRLHTTCKTLTGPAMTVKLIRAEGPDKAVVVYERLGFTFSYTLVYEDGQWRFQPDDEAMAGYAMGVDKLIADKTAAGTCG